METKYYFYKSFKDAKTVAFSSQIWKDNPYRMTRKEGFKVRFFFRSVQNLNILKTMEPIILPI